MRVLITGAGGFVGRVLVRRLQELGDEVIAVVRPGRRGAIDGTGCRVLEQDLLRGWCGPARMKLDAVVHLAQSKRYREFPEAAAEIAGVIVQGTVLVADTAVRCGATQMVYASSGSIYAPSAGPVTESTPPAPRDFYARSKLVGEQLLEDFRRSFNLKIVRPFFIYGPGQGASMLFPRLLASVCRGTAITLEASASEDLAAQGGLRFTPHYIDDHVECLVRVLRRSGHLTINLAGRQRTSIREVATILGRYLARLPEFRHGTNTRPGDFICDTSPIASLLGEVPSTELEVGIERMVSQAREQEC